MKSFILFFLSITSLHTIEMTDYRTIYGQYDEAYVNGSLKATTGNQEQSSYDTLLNANTRTIHTTAVYSFDFNVKGDLGLSQGEDKNSSQKSSYHGFSSLRYDRYLAYDNLFIYGGGDVGYRKEQTSTQADNIFSKVGLGIGYGRVYNATPLAIALRIVEELQRYQVLKQELSDVDLLKLAKIIGTKDNYISKYGLENYKKYWFLDMEKLFKEAKVSYQEHLGAVGILKMEEVLEIEKVSGRLHGWKIRGGVGRVISSYDGEGESSTTDMEFSYGLPVGYESQFIENALLSKNLYNNSPIDFSFENSMSYTYEITDIIDWEMKWNFYYNKYYEGDDIVKNRVTLGFRYYLANSLTLDTTISLNKIDGTNGNSIETPEWDGDLFVGVHYRLK
jgi:hypothetical protein